MRTVSLIVSILVAASAFSIKAEECNPSMKLEECVDALQKKNKSIVKKEVLVKTSAKKLSDKNTGSQNGSGSATEDFNPRMQFSADSLGISGDGNGGLTFAWNDLMQGIIDVFVAEAIDDEGNLIKAQKQHHKLIVKLEEAKLFEPLDTIITDDALKQKLESELDDFDNVSFDFRFSFNSERHGRDIQSHTSLISDIQSESRGDVITADEARDKAVDRLADVVAELPTTWNDQNSLEKNFGGSEKAEDFIKLLATDLKANNSYQVAFNAATKKNGLDGLVKLINNQPQFVFSIKANVRDVITGPDEYSAAITYELGGVNYNKYKKFQPGCVTKENKNRAVPLRPSAARVKCLTRYLDANINRLNTGDRLSFSLEYKYKDQYDFSNSGFVLNTDAENSLVVNLTYARYMNLGLDALGATGDSRLDIAASYEDVDKDPMRNDRGILTASITQKMTSGLYLTFGLKWANKPEYRGEVDKEISARAGISYKLAKQ